MRAQQTIMGMPVIVDIAQSSATRKDLDLAFDYFCEIDERFSPFKPSSEVSTYDPHAPQQAISPELQEILAKSEETRKQTNGFFDVFAGGVFNPSGLVKGWAILRAAQILDAAGFTNYYVEAGGDIQVRGKNQDGKPWRIGIRHPFEKEKIIKVLSLQDGGIATSGTYERGEHILDPRSGLPVVTDIVSLTVVGPDIYEADRFATAAFAMGNNGLAFIERLDGHEGYAVDRTGTATMSSGFDRFIHHA